MFLTAGLAIKHLGGADTAQRKATERRLDALETAGLVEFTRQGARRIAWKLTDRADWTLRARCDLWGVEEMLVALACIAAHQRAGATVQGHWVPEFLITGLNWGTRGADRRAVVLADVLAPAACRGFAHSHSDCGGRVAYSVTAAGLAYLDAPELPTDLPGPEPNAVDAYQTALTTAVEELRTATPSRRNAVVIPLSAGLWEPEKPPAKVSPVFTQEGIPRKA